MVSGQSKLTLEAKYPALAISRFVPISEIPQSNQPRVLLFAPKGWPNFSRPVEHAIRDRSTGATERFGPASGPIGETKSPTSRDEAAVQRSSSPSSTALPSRL